MKNIKGQRLLGMWTLHMTYRYLVHVKKGKASIKTCKKGLFMIVHTCAYSTYVHWNSHSNSKDPAVMT